MVERTWSCCNQCKSDCCSEVFLNLTDSQKEQWEKKKAIFMTKRKDVYRYLSFHKGIELLPVNKMTYILKVKRGIKRELKKNPFNDQWYLCIDDPCSKLMTNKRCKIYRARPQICMVGKCPVFETDKKITWFGHNGKLKRFMKNRKARDI